MGVLAQRRGFSSPDFVWIDVEASTNRLENPGGYFCIVRQNDGVAHRFALNIALEMAHGVIAPTECEAGDSAAAEVPAQDGAEPREGQPYTRKSVNDASIMCGGGSGIGSRASARQALANFSKTVSGAGLNVDSGSRIALMSAKTCEMNVPTKACFASRSVSPCAAKSNSRHWATHLVSSRTRSTLRLKRRRWVGCSIFTSSQNAGGREKFPAGAMIGVGP